jgi:small-conductance mechanosensitive channel
MGWSERVGAFLSDDRLLFNLIAVHAAIALLLILSVIARAILQNGGDRFRARLGTHWLHGITHEATQHARSLVWWTTLLLMAVTVAGGVFYHLGGGDIRTDLAELWQQHVTPTRLITAGWIAAQLVGIAVVAMIACRFVHRLRTAFEAVALDHLPKIVTPETPAHDPQTPVDHHERSVRRGFDLLERCGVLLVFFLAAGIGAGLVGMWNVSGALIGMAIPLLGTVLIARLLTMATKTISHALVNFGNRRVGSAAARRYWERFLRLVPFTERCFEAAVYSGAAGVCLIIVGCFSDLVHGFTPKIELCIGIFFMTRVFIELSHVLLKHAFGLYDDTQPTDQKGATLVPLLQSAIQYSLYFLCGALIAGELTDGKITTYLLAGASFLGLAVGLGAQSLVGDIVSGFFILFENQYLVGDVVQIGDAVGHVEAIAIRHTQIRDEQGKLYIIPNGQIKSVVNYSKGYVNAVVDIKVPTSMSLEQVMKDMAEAGRRLRTSRREVLADTVVRGLVDLTPGEMTIRAVTKVMPGTHGTMQSEYRRLLKEVFDQRATMKAAA